MFYTSKFWLDPKVGFPLLLPRSVTTSNPILEQWFGPNPAAE